MLGPYHTKPDKTLSYKGNKIFSKIENISQNAFDSSLFSNRVKELATDKMWTHISKINHAINISANEYFDKMGALFTILPLTTRMISSPGAVYGKEAISYTTDTSPIVLDWFDLEKKVFLAESSQIYLELALLQQGVDNVYAVYNSFRKENADFSHLAEFHHIEYEGKVKQKENISIALGLVQKILKDILDHNIENLDYFLSNEQIKKLDNLASSMDKIPNIKFAEALELLYKKTNDERFKVFTQEGNFGSWEEVLLTEIIGGMVIVSEFPLLEVPFYHDILANSTPPVAVNSDFIWGGYREFLGSGQRIGGINDLDYKAKVFDLPKEDYEPYLQSRRISTYTQTSGFGMGWERFVQGLLELPYIWSASHFPRGHQKLIP